MSWKEEIKKELKDNATYLPKHKDERERSVALQTLQDDYAPKGHITQDISSIKGSETVALELLEQVGIERLTKGQIIGINNKFKLIESMDKETITTKLAIIFGLGLHRNDFFPEGTRLIK
tara:strand:+ start:540 stop:899 length:360 start_codon:yes stop_codon:yes gene_type:complete